MPKCEKCGSTEDIYNYLVADDHMNLCPSCALEIKKAGIDVNLDGEAVEALPKKAENENREEKNESQPDKKNNKIFGLLVSFFALLIVGFIISNTKKEEEICKECEDAPYSSYTWNEISNTATCTSEGIATYKCLFCGRTTEIPSDMKEHDFKKISDTSTCTTDGEKTLQCLTCNYQTTEVSPAAHSWEYQYKDVTCMRDGFEYYSCVNCSETKNVPLAKSTSYCNLQYENTVFDKADKYKQYKCSVCGRIELEKVSFGSEISTSNEYFFYCTTAAKDYVSQNLMYPSNSTFQSDGSMKVYKLGSNYTCVGYVDASNAFGVKARKYFAVTMTLTLLGDQFSYSVKDFEIY